MDCWIDAVRMAVAELTFSAISGAGGQANLKVCTLVIVPHWHKVQIIMEPKRDFSLSRDTLSTPSAIFSSSSPPVSATRIAGGGSATGLLPPLPGADRVVRVADITRRISIGQQSGVGIWAGTEYR